jgi:endonuclease YncB( thermonuclease family)
VARTFQLWAEVYRWIDGDTFTGVIDQGFHTFRGSSREPQSIRCALINTPEMNIPSGLSARVYAETLVPVGSVLACISYKPDNYGRPLIDLILPSGEMYSQHMLKAAHAVPYK